MPWTDLEMRLLIQSSRDMLPMLASAMERPLKEVVLKFNQLRTILEEKFKMRAKRYMDMGFDRDDALLKLAMEEKIDFKKIHEM